MEEFTSGTCNGIACYLRTLSNVKCRREKRKKLFTSPSKKVLNIPYSCDMLIVWDAVLPEDILCGAEHIWALVV